MTYNINHADIFEWAKNYKGEPFDAVLCDPPYELGFMGKSWDSTGIAFNKDMWEAVFNILKPGGHLLAFSGSRTYHRMAVAIEDAGFEIRDMIEWVYGSGFPKSLNIGKAVDKIQGNEREDLGEHIQNKTNPDSKNRSWQSEDGVGNKWNLSKGTSPYEGYGTALKPAHEPCVLARKPIEGTVANNVLNHGTGGLNIDGSRITSELPENRQRHGGGLHSDKIGQLDPKAISTMPSGRFPANLIHDGSDEVVGLFPDTKGQYGGKGKAANSKSGKYGWNNSKEEVNNRGATQGISDSGSAARFFYTAKASKSERNAGLEGFGDKATHRFGAGIGEGLDPNAPSYDKNHHPTVKPLSLTKYLANLIKPPTGGRLLVPFSGSGSEMIGALQAGWEHVEGVELTEEYIPIAEARIKYWTSIIETESEQVSLL